MKLPFQFDSPNESVGFLLWQTTVMWQRSIKKILDPYKISHSQFVIMALLLWMSEKQEQVTQADIVSWSKMDKMTISKSLKELAKLDFVCRSENCSDTRVKDLKLTANGKIMISKIVPEVEAMDGAFFQHLSQSDKNSLIKIIMLCRADPKS